MAEKEREDAKALLEQISWMLIIDWDPIGIRHDVAEVKDEYDRVAARLISMINAGAEVSAIADYLVEVETREFGLVARPERAEAVARHVHHVATWKPILPTPEEFVYLARGFHQDMMMFASTEKGLVANALRLLNAKEQLIVKRFLTALLDLNPSGEELQNIWKSTDPDWGFDDDGLRYMFALIRDMAGGED